MIRYPLLLPMIVLFLKLWGKTLWRKFGEVGYIETYGESCMIISETPSGAVPSFSMYFRIAAKAKSVAMEYKAFRDLKSVRHPSLKVLRQWSLVERSVDFVRSDRACGNDQNHGFLILRSELLNLPGTLFCIHSEILRWPIVGFHCLVPCMCNFETMSSCLHQKHSIAFLCS
ncbi:hypothetical protein PoB_006386000 [Plakobranchus ocellatus]|uniref:Protein kinase domain-containing protein n=1 Tax=Plakobranchus ocellatus TaxID=259542 RepID=A0AAV4CZW3_9GAST|nr:hypothetical protein PoB_006386000 [Plakobranchus ocellatus]